MQKNRKNILKNYIRLRNYKFKIKKLFEVTNLLYSSTDIKKLINSILLNAQEVLNTQSASLFLFDNEKKLFYFHSSSNLKDSKFIGTYIPDGKGIVNISANTKKNIIVNDVKNDKRVFIIEQSDKKIEINNLIAIPMFVDEICIGVIEVINTKDKKPFKSKDLKIFKIYANSVTLALHKNLLIENLENSKNLYKKESNINTLLKELEANQAIANNIVEYLNQILEIIYLKLGIQKQSILIFDHKINNLKLIASRGINLEEEVLINQDLDNIKNTNLTNNESEKIKHNISLLDKNVTTFSKNIAKQIFKDEINFFSNNIFDEEKFKNLIKNYSNYKSNSCIVLHLNIYSTNLNYGVYCLSDPSKGYFTEDDFKILKNVSHEISRNYQRFLFYRDQELNLAQKTEFEIAEKVQMDILPNYFGPHNFFEIETGIRMANCIGGDLYYYQSDSKDSNVNFLIGDVTGKSIAAAIFMSMVSIILKTMLNSESKPNEILYKINKLMYKESKRGMFVTLFLGNYDPKNNILEYASAGHNQMILVRDNGDIEMLSAHGFPLGVKDIEKNFYEKKSINFYEGDTLILYTDGIIESRNKNNKEFGLNGLLDVIKKNKSSIPSSLISFIFEELRKFIEVDFDTFYKGENFNKNLNIENFSNYENDDLALMVCRVKKSNQRVLIYHIVLKPTIENTILIIKEIEQILININLSDNFKTDIILSIEEVLVNIVTHAFDDYHISKPEMEFTLSLEKDKKFYFEFRDNGKEFNFYSIKSHNIPSLLKSNVVGGFGVTLIKRLMENLIYKNQYGLNFLSFEKRLN